MNKSDVLKAIYTKEEFDEMVEERVSMYLAGYRYLQPDEMLEKQRMRLMQEDKIKRENGCAD